MKPVTITIAMLVFFFISGCACQETAMIPYNIETINHHSGSIYVDASGGEQSNPLWTAEISDGDFEAAAEKAIRASVIVLAQMAKP